MLRGYRLAFCGGGHADILRHAGGLVQGALYEVRADDIAALDRYEGVPTYYHRIIVSVTDSAGGRQKAQAYKMNSGASDAEPSLSYVLTIVCGCRDWGIEPNPVVKAALEAQISNPAEENRA